MIFCTGHLDKTVLLCYELIKHYTIMYCIIYMHKLICTYLKTYNAVSFIALLAQFNATHDFTLAEINKKQEISVLVCLYVILKFSIFLLFPLKELYPLVNNKDNWYEMLFIDTWNESAKRARVVGRGRGRNKQTSAQTDCLCDKRSFYASGYK